MDGLLMNTVENSVAVIEAKDTVTDAAELHGAYSIEASQDDVVSGVNVHRQGGRRGLRTEQAQHRCCRRCLSGYWSSRRRVK